ncbi:MAG: amino acid adenylation domain-containing protein [Bacteroidales bacterium]|nr:amino acid adenylation domain-containing protein [Bacteroidales bacterium]
MSNKIEKYWENKLFDSKDANIGIFYSGYEGKNSINQKRYTLPSSLSGKINSICNKSDLKLFTFLASITNLLLFNYFNSPRILLLSPVIQQNTNQKLLNYILVYQSEIKANISFKDFLLSVWKEISTSTEHQNFPLKDLIKKASANITPLNDVRNVGILLENIHSKSYLGDIPNLLFCFNKKQDEIECTIEYKNQAFTDTAIDKIWECFTTLTTNILNDLSSDISRIDLISKEQKEEFLFEFNNTNKAIGDDSIVDYFNKQVAQLPDKIAVIMDNLFITYKELGKRSDHFSAVLNKNGLGTNHICAVYLDRSIHFIISILGILKAGAAYLPMDRDYPVERIKYIVKDSKVEIVIVDNESYKVDIECNKLNIEKIDFNAANEALPEINYNKENAAYVIYTSGSTGIPKGVIIKQEGVLNYALWAIDHYIGNNEITFPLFTSISFDLTVTSIFTPLLSGNKIKIYEAKQNSAFLLEKILKENQVDIIKVTPSHLRYLIQLYKYKPTSNNSDFTSNIKKIIVGGEDLKTDLANSVLDIFGNHIEIYNEYGPTETVVGSIIYKFKRDAYLEYQSVAIGKPIANTKVYICNKFGGIMAQGVEGEILIGGSGVSMGYINKPEATHERYIHHSNNGEQQLYKTGDRAKWIDSESILFLGRLDEQVKIRGFRIELGEIENTAKNFADIDDCKAIVINDNENIIVCVMAQSKIDQKELSDHFSQYLPEYMIPSEIYQVDKIPLTINGKIDTSELLSMRQTKEVTEGYVAPNSKTEKIISEIWGEELNIAKVGIYDNFFTIGGTSLNMIKVNSRIQETLEKQIEIIHMFEYTTIQSLSEFIDNQMVNN